MLDSTATSRPRADGFLRDLTLTGILGDPAGPAMMLPVPGGRTSLHSAELHLDFGDATRWNGLVVLDRLQAADIEMEDVTLRLGGLAQHLDDPARRNVTVNVEGLATGVWADEPEVARALGTRIDLFADATLPPGGPVTVHQLQLSGNGLSIFSAGAVRESGLYRPQRDARRRPRDLRRPRRPDRSAARSTCAPTAASPRSAAAFDLTFDGGATDLVLGEPRLDPLLAGETTVSRPGGARRGRRPHREPRIANPQVTFASDGQHRQHRDRHRLPGQPRRPRRSSIPASPAR